MYTTLNSSSKSRIPARRMTEPATSVTYPEPIERLSTLATIPNTIPTASPPNTRRSSKRVRSTYGRSNRRRENQSTTSAGAMPSARATRKSTRDTMEAEWKPSRLLKRADLPLIGRDNKTRWFMRFPAARIAGPMPGKQPRVLCPVCQEPIPPDETECENCGAFVIDEAVVRLSRALGLDREKALRLFEQGFRHPTQLKDRDPDAVLEKGEVGLLFICTNCGGFVAGADSKCPRCAAEFELETEEVGPAEEDILDIVLCPICGADNDSDAPECEICGEPLKEVTVPRPSPEPAKAHDAVPMEDLLARVDDFLGHVDPEAAPLAPPPKPAVEPAPPAPKREVAPAAPPAAPVPAPVPLKPVPATVPRPIPKPPIRPRPAVKPTP